MDDEYFLDVQTIIKGDESGGPARLVLVVRGFPDLHVRVASVIGPSWAMSSRTTAQRSTVRPLLIQLVAP